MTLMRCYLPALVLGVWALAIVSGIPVVLTILPGLVALGISSYVYMRDVRHRLRRLEKLWRDHV